MSEAKHTPGPWKVDGNLRSVDGKCFTGEYKTICSPVRGGNPEEADANARLIAAAPDLYASLLETREVAAACFRTVAKLNMIDVFLAELPPDLETRSEGFGKRADEALAKAEGRA